MTRVKHSLRSDCGWLLSRCRSRGVRNVGSSGFRMTAWLGLPPQSKGTVACVLNDGCYDFCRRDARSTHHEFWLRVAEVTSIFARACQVPQIPGRCSDMSAPILGWARG